MKIRHGEKQLSTGVLSQETLENNIRNKTPDAAAYYKGTNILTGEEVMFTDFFDHKNDKIKKEAINALLDKDPSAKIVCDHITNIEIIKRAKDFNIKATQKQMATILNPKKDKIKKHKTVQVIYKTTRKFSPTT